MNPHPHSIHSRGGYALSAALRVVLLLFVVGQVVYLAREYHVRFDFTSDKVFTFTDSTRKVLGGLDDRLLVEAYFTPESKLPLYVQPYRRALTSILDEYAQMSDGKLVLRYYDPHSDKAIEEKAQRLGMQPQNLQDVQRGESISVQMVWQGVRLRYGSDKQKVIPFLGFAQEPFQYEGVLTPLIKDLAVKQKPKVGFLAFATEGQQMSPYMQQQQGEGPKRFDQIKEAIKGRYEVVDLDLSEGKLVPDEVKTIVLIRPKNLTDRQKYALDQFVMKGGKLLCFVDTDEYEIGQRRSFLGRDVSYDAADAKLKFLDQLAHYGAKVEDKVVADMLGDAQEPFYFVMQALGNMPILQPLQYPYWVHALPIDYAQHAQEIANALGATNGDSAEVAEGYRKTFKPGMAGDHVVVREFEARGQGPGMFWPCPVGLTEQLPEGVNGKVLLRSSPLAVVETPPPSLDPLGTDRNARVRLETYNTFMTKLHQRLRSEPRQQVPLMVSLSGKFKSFFAGKEIPPAKPPQVAQATGPSAGNPLDAPIGSVTPQPETPAAKSDSEASSGTGSSEAAGNEEPQSPKPAADKTEPAKAAPDKANESKANESKANESKAGESKAGESKDTPKGGPRASLDWNQAQQGQEPKAGDAPQPGEKPAEKAAEKPADPAAADEAAAKAAAAEAPQEPAKPDLLGPQPAAAPAAPSAPKEPDPIFEGQDALIVVVGDSDMVRDDMFGEYGQVGPTSRLGAVFFVSMLDWMAEDQDLLALRAKQPVDRRLSFAEERFGTAASDPDVLERRAEWLRAVNIGAPVLALSLIGLIVGLRRRAQKQSFIARTES